jgi:hypothetical protein
VFVPFTIAARCLGLTRPKLSAAIGTGRLRSATIDRRQHVSLQDALQYAREYNVGTREIARLQESAVQARRPERKQGA